MQSTDTTPRFRNLAINSTPRFPTSSFLFDEKIPEEHRDPEYECFMCRQANVYIKPIGMQQERRVARQHPPPLTRAQMEELSQKKHLTKREARLLLQCYFPEIKNVKYFQLHKYHSCCYDPKHLNLCKNHITALQHERELYPHHHQETFDKNGEQQNRVSFVRIKIEPVKGIPTRFLGPTALPESLADMLIKQVNRYENKKKPLSFNSTSQNALNMYNVKRLGQPDENGTTRLSEHLANLNSDDDDEEEEEDGDDYSDEEENQLRNPNSNIRGFQGKVTGRLQTKHGKKLRPKQEKGKLPPTGDLVVEDLDELNHFFVNEHNPSIFPKSSKPMKKKKHKKRTKKHPDPHPVPKLNHWEIMALDQSKQEPCGCRHHVRRLEADQVVYDWCRCKDHLHQDLKVRRKLAPPPPPPPPSPPPKKSKKIIRSKSEKKTIGINTTEPTTTELALAYDPNTVDYDVLEEALYYRTTSGRLVKPEISNAFTYNNISSLKGLNHYKTLGKKSGLLSTTPRDPFSENGKQQLKIRYSSADSFISSNPGGSVSNGQTLVDTELLSTNVGTNELMPVYKLPRSRTTTTPNKGMYDEEEDEEDGVVEFNPPKYMPEIPEDTLHSPLGSPTIPMSMQKSSKPTYTNEKPTPNFERESSALANRRWFDQALGDQNLLAIQDGRYGLIAGTSAVEYQTNSQLPDNTYVEPYKRTNKSNCTIS